MINILIMLIHEKCIENSKGENSKEHDTLGISIICLK